MSADTIPEERVETVKEPAKRWRVRWITLRTAAYSPWGPYGPGEYKYGFLSHPSAEVAEQRARDIEAALLAKHGFLFREFDAAIPWDDAQ